MESAELGTFSIDRIGTCRHIVVGMLRTEKVPEHVIADMESAVGELVGNYAKYEKNPKPVTLYASKVEEEGHCYAAVEIRGMSYIPPHAMPTFSESENPPLHGYGLAIINALVEYQPLPGDLGILLTKDC